MLATHQKAGADVTIATMPVTREAAHAFGIMRADDRRPSGRISGEAKDRSRRSRHGAHGADVDRCPRRAQQRARFAGQHGHLSFQSDHAAGRADQDRLSRFRQGSISRLNAQPQSSHAFVRRVLGRHWHDQVVLQCNLDLAKTKSAVRFGLRPTGADLHPGQIPAAVALERRDHQQQLDCRRLPNRSGHCDRKQRSRLADSYWPRRCRSATACCWGTTFTNRESAAIKRFRWASEMERSSNGPSSTRIAASAMV